MNFTNSVNPLIENSFTLIGFSRHFAPHLFYDLAPFSLIWGGGGLLLSWLLYPSFDIYTCWVWRGKQLWRSWILYLGVHLHFCPRMREGGCLVLGTWKVMWLLRLDWNSLSRNGSSRFIKTPYSTVKIVLRLVEAALHCVRPRNVALPSLPWPFKI